MAEIKAVPYELLAEQLANEAAKELALTFYRPEVFKGVLQALIHDAIEIGIGINGEQSPSELMEAYNAGYEKGYSEASK